MTGDCVAVLSFPRNEFRLRRDISMLLESCGFVFDGEGAPESLLFINEVPWERLKPEGGGSGGSQ